jgi:hypothetical protein
MTNMTHARRLLLPLLLASLLSPLLALLLPAETVRAQTRQSKSGDELFQKVAALDEKLFGAYNACDLDTFASLVADDVEFYHDQGGVIRDKQALVDAVKKNICGTTRRELIPGTLEVHPMNNFGALQIGSHRFCAAKNKTCDGAGGGVGKFIHLWQNSGGTWKLTRVISYDHASAPASK